ncbi:unnamed protein product, partial [Brenthis ino]
MANSGQSGESLKCAVLRKYYLENDYFVSPEGILKGLSIISCTVSSILFIWGGGCSVAISGTAGGLTLGAGAALAVLGAAILLSFAALAPMTCFISDVVVSTAIGASLLLVALLSVIFCEAQNSIAYTYGPLSLINAALVIGSAILTYMSVTSRWDAASGPAASLRPHSDEQEV